MSEVSGEDQRATGDEAGPAAERRHIPIGIITGRILLVLAFLAMIGLAVAGFRPALYLLALLAAGVVLIVGGGKIHRL